MINREIKCNLFVFLLSDLLKILFFNITCLCYIVHPLCLKLEE